MATTTTSETKFSDIESTEELKILLGLEDERPLWVARLDEEKYCAAEDCPYPPFLSNGGKCALHNQNWWPKSDKQRGHWLLDPEFLVPAAAAATHSSTSTSSSNKTVVCCCQDKTCFAMGHSPFGYIRVPSQKQYRKDIVRSMQDSLSQSVRHQLLETTRTDLYLAPWHFYPDHRALDRRDKKMVIKKPRGGLRDSSGKHYYFPPANHSPQQFVKTELAAALLSREGLPGWVHCYKAIETALLMTHPNNNNHNEPSSSSEAITTMEEEEEKTKKKNGNDTSLDETAAETVVESDISQDISQNLSTFSSPVRQRHQFALQSPINSNANRGGGGGSTTANGHKSNGSPPRQSERKQKHNTPSSRVHYSDEVVTSGTTNSLLEPLLPEGQDTVDGYDDDGDGDGDDGYVHISSTDTDLYLPDPKRFIVLAVYCACNLLASAEWITFAPVEDAVRVRYGITSLQVNWLSLIFMAAYGPGTLLASWGIRKLGLRTSVVASAFLMALGSLMRWSSIYLLQPIAPEGSLSLFLSGQINDDDDNNSSSSSSTMAYPVLFCGQALVAFAQPVFANTPARVASAWFSNTTNAVGFAVFTAMVGMVIGQAMSPLCVTESNGNHLGDLLAGQAFCMILCAGATWWWFQTEPDVPPSAAEAARRHSAQTGDAPSLSSLWKDICKLSTDIHYILMLVAFGIGYGINNAVLTLLQPWISGVGFPGDKVAGLCGSLVIIGGIVGTLVAAPLLDASRNYTSALRWSFVVQFLVAVAAVATLQPRCPVWVLATAFTAIGMSQCPLLTICLDAAAAHTYPISEELSSAGLQLVGQYLGVAFTNGMGVLLDHSKGAVGYTAPINVAFLALLGAASLIALFYKGEDARANANANALASPVASNTSAAEHDEENPESELL